MGRIANALNGHKVTTFWSKAERAPNGCLEWTAARHDYGYGTFGIGTVTFKAHRLAYWFAKGPFDEALCVLHKCDNPPCVDPDHLFLGTKLDNVKDCWKKGRASPPPRLAGERNHRAKLKAADVKKIRKLLVQGISQREIARMFGVDKYTIWRIAAGRGWKCQP